MKSFNAGWIGLFLLLPITAANAADLTSASYTVRGATLNGGGAVGMVSELGAGSAFGEVGATIGQGGPIGIGQDDPLLITLEAGFWPMVAALAPLDSDDDGIPDGTDNCTLVANPEQTDTDADGYGNACDGDFNNNDVVDFADYGYFRAVFGTDDALSDFNGNGIVDFADYGRFRTMFGEPPGPAAP
jgi:hypothetical protein